MISHLSCRGLYRFDLAWRTLTSTEPRLNRYSTAHSVAGILNPLMHECDNWICSRSATMVWQLIRLSVLYGIHADQHLRRRGRPIHAILFAFVTIWQQIMICRVSAVGSSTVVPLYRTSYHRSLRGRSHILNSGRIWTSPTGGAWCELVQTCHVVVCGRVSRVGVFGSAKKSRVTDQPSVRNIFGPMLALISANFELLT